MHTPFFGVIFIALASFIDANSRQNEIPQLYLNPPQYMAAILVNNEPVCAGAFIKKDRVVTTAECVYGKSDLVVGVKSPKPDDGDKKKVKQAYVHPYYRPSLLGYNVAVVKTEEPFDQVSTLKLAEKDPEAGKTLHTNSWDAESENQKFVSVESTVVNRTICKTTLMSHASVTGKLLCLSVPDSKLPYVKGSPVAFVDEANNYNNLLHGVATFSVKNTTENMPKLYVNFANPEIYSFLEIFT